MLILTNAYHLIFIRSRSNYTLHVNLLLNYLEMHCMCSGAFFFTKNQFIYVEITDLYQTHEWNL